jgi:membrane protease subunit HflC
MNRSLVGALFIALIVAIAIANTFYSVSETEQAVLLQFGKSINTIQAAGLNVKIPFVQNVLKFDKRILSVEKDSIEVFDKERQRLLVDAFVRYRIVDPLQYYKTLGSEDIFKSLLESVTRNVIANTTISAVLSQERDAVMGNIQKQVATAAASFGINVVDVRIRRTDLPPQNRDSIVDRMVAERTREANQLRAEGTEISNRITAQAERDKTVLLADATRQSEILKGEGDAERNRIYADAYTKDPEFFAFYRSMLAYTEALKSQNTTMVIAPSGEFFQFLGSDRGK